MPVRIGGSVGGIPTWGRLRSPVCLDNKAYVPIIKWTRFSRIYNDSTGDDFPKAFIWKSGSLFRCLGWFGPNTFWNPPYYWIEGYPGNPETDPPSEPSSRFGMGIFVYGPPDQIDNQDFMQLIGEDVETDGGTFAITERAHDWGYPQYAWQEIEGIYGTKVLTIGKLTPV